MRIWYIDPGYLNRQGLLEEHRELHGIVSIIVNRKKGYSNNPETVHWVGYQKHNKAPTRPLFRFDQKRQVSLTL